MLTIFVWRIVAKSFCHFILPPTFRFLSHLFTLPHRRFYTPATDYTSVPPEKGLRPIPSVIDLPRMVELEVDGVGVASSARRNGTYGAVKQRAGRAARQEVSEKGTGGKDGVSQAAWEGSRKNGRDVKHYDADGESFFPCPGLVKLHGHRSGGVSGWGGRGWEVILSAPFGYPDIHSRAAQNRLH